MKNIVYTLLWGKRGIENDYDQYYLIQQSIIITINILKNIWPIIYL